jgi:hypothetical protein
VTTLCVFVDIAIHSFPYFEDKCVVFVYTVLHLHSINEAIVTYIIFL